MEVIPEECDTSPAPHTEQHKGTHRRVLGQRGQGPRLGAFIWIASKNYICSQIMLDSTLMVTGMHTGLRTILKKEKK